MAKRNKRRIGAFSRRLSLSDLDLRTNAGKFANSIKDPSARGACKFRTYAVQYTDLPLLKLVISS
jgi:hypothetical protein